MAHLRVVGATRRAPVRRGRRLRLSPVHLFLMLLFWMGLAAVLWPSLPGLSLPGLPSLPQTQGGELVAGTYIFRTCAAPPHRTCVMDGDTFYFRGESIRIADIAHRKRIRRAARSRRRWARRRPIACAAC